MKTMFFAFVTFVAISFAACGDKTQAGCANDTDSVVVDSMVIDSMTVDTAFAE